MDLSVAEEPAGITYSDGKAPSNGYGGSINSALFKINEDLFQGQNYT